MQKEIQPLSLKTTKEGTPESYTAFCELTPDALGQLKTMLGKPIELTATEERWIYQGPDEEDHSTVETRVRGTLEGVDKQTITVKIVEGESKPDYGRTTRLDGMQVKFPFYQEQFRLQRSAEISQVFSLTIDGKTYRQDDSVDDLKKAEIPSGNLAHLQTPTDPWTSAAQADPSPSMSEYYEGEGRATNRN